MTDLEKAAQQEPVGQLMEEAYGRGQVLWFNKPDDLSMLYTSPPQRKPWVGLTREEKQHIIDANFGGSRADCMDEAERILRRKNT